MATSGTAGGRRALAKPDEVAAYLGVSVRTLTEWRYRRKGPRWAPVGRHVRYRWDDVEKWYDQQTKAAA